MNISVVITVYNLQQYVRQAIDSALTQTVRPFEVIVVDDCSTDDSAAIIQSYGTAVTYIKNERNSGVLLSTINGMRRASGDIITFLDGDDIWEADKLEKIGRYYEHNEKAILVTHNHKYIDGVGAPIDKQDETHANVARIVKEAAGDTARMSDLLRASILTYRGVWLGSAYTFRRAALDLDAFDHWVHSFPDPHLSYQDHPLAQFIILNAPEGIVGYIHEPLFQYRVFGNNSSGASFSIESALRTITKLEMTTLRTYNLVKAHNAGEAAIHAQALKLSEVTYLKSLYSGKKSTAIALFFRLAGKKWSGAQTVKELFRLTGVTLLGKKLFFRLKSTV